MRVSLRRLIGAWFYPPGATARRRRTRCRNCAAFTAGSGSSSTVTNSDGANPYAGLIFADNTLYGTATGGGSSGNGTVFSLSFAPQLTITSSGTNVILTLCFIKARSTHELESGFSVISVTSC